MSRGSMECDINSNSNDNIDNDRDEDDHKSGDDHKS